MRFMEYHSSNYLPYETPFMSEQFCAANVTMLGTLLYTFKLNKTIRVFQEWLQSLSEWINDRSIKY